jgi:SAM-dependent methyltransferase
MRDALPVPPPELRAGYGTTSDDYVRGGEADFAKMLAVLEAAGYRVPAGRVLDFGCAAGRMLRFWPRDLEEAWGADISAPHVAWCQRNLGPPFRVALTSTEPRLPFPSGHFDFVYAASVFTHIASGEDDWIRELGRTLKPGGMAWVTIHDETSVDRLLAMPGHWLSRRLAAMPGGAPSLFERFSVGDGTPGDTAVFHGLRFLTSRWGEWLRVVSVTPDAYYYQTALLLERPDDGSPRAR